MSEIQKCRRCSAPLSGGSCQACKAKRAAYYVANREKEKAASAARYAANAEKIKIRHAEWRAANPEKVKSSNDAWKKNNPDKCKSYDDAWRAANPEKAIAKASKWQKANPEKAKSIRFNWWAANPSARKIYSHNRRAMVRKAGGTLSKGLFDKLYSLQKGKCACCHADLVKTKAHLDHVMPIALGGPNTDDNIQLLCQPCNNQKHTKHPIDFMQSRGFLL